VILFSLESKDIVKEIKRMSSELKGNVIISLDATLSIQVINNYLSFSFSVRSMTIKTAKMWISVISFENDFPEEKKRTLLEIFSCLVK